MGHDSSKPPRGQPLVDVGADLKIGNQNPSSIAGGLKLPPQETLRPARGGLRNTPQELENDLPTRTIEELHAAAAKLPSHAVIGDYDVLGRVGKGGMAEALLARIGDRPVVIKRLRSTQANKHRELFRLEIERSLTLSHPNLPKGHSHFELESRDHLVMEWIYGVTLKQLALRAHRIGGLPPNIAVAIVDKVAAALAFLHGLDEALVHCDVSPHNIMVGYDGHVVLLDLGVASRPSDLAENPRQLRGKLRYASPEQLVGQPIDTRADLFSLGVTLHETLTGNALFSRPDEASTVEAITSEPIPSVLTSRPSMPLALCEFLERAMSRDREHRFQSAEAFSAALRRAVKPAPHAEVTSAVQGLFESEIEAGLILDVEALHPKSAQRASGAEFPAARNTKRREDETREHTEPNPLDETPADCESVTDAEPSRLLSILDRLFPGS